MRVTSVHIERKPSYDAESPNLLVGTVHLDGENGATEVKLSSRVLVELFKIVKADCVRVANLNAMQITEAIDEAEMETPVSEAPEIIDDSLPFLT